MTINLPGSKLAYVAGDPIWVPRDAGEAELGVRARAGRARAQRGHRARLRARRRRPQTRHAAEPRRSGRAAGRSRFPPQGLSHRHEPAAPDRAAASSRCASAAARRIAPPARRAPRACDDRAPQRRAVLGARGERRRDQRRAAGDRGARRRAARSQFPAHHRHRHLGRPRRAAPGPARRAPVRAARCTGICGALPRPLAARPRRVHRIRDLAVAHPRDGGAQHSDRARQRPPVAPQPPPLAAQQVDGRAAVRPLQHRAGAERAPGARLLGARRPQRHRRSAT